MGCSCSKDSVYEKVSSNSKNGSTNADSYFYNLKITLPSTEKTLKATFEIDCEKVLLYELVNHICFNSKFGEVLDANFISKYNEENDDFHYYIYSIYGKRIENETEPEKGKMWIPFINDNKEDWTEICRKNRLVSSSDTVEFVYALETDLVNM